MMARYTGLTTQLQTSYQRLVHLSPTPFERASPRRLVVVLLFLTIFSLPLHFHPIAAAAQVAKECGCVHGSRSEPGLAPAAQWCGFLTAFECITVDAQSASDYDFHRDPRTRAPPRTLSR
jgi:hypothetical protein